MYIIRKFQCVQERNVEMIMKIKGQGIWIDLYMYMCNFRFDCVLIEC